MPAPEALVRLPCRAPGDSKTDVADASSIDVLRELPPAGGPTVKAQLQGPMLGTACTWYQPDWQQKSGDGNWGNYCRSFGPCEPRTVPELMAEMGTIIRTMRA